MPVCGNREGAWCHRGDRGVSSSRIDRDVAVHDDPTERQPRCHDARPEERDGVRLIGARELDVRRAVRGRAVEQWEGVSTPP